MDQTWVRDYIERYLSVHQCDFIERAPGHTTVKLSVDVDKDITNRPYYWTFVERTGAEPETLTMNFIFDPEQAPNEIRGEEINLGSERLKQFFRSAKKRGRMVRLYQENPPINPRKRVGLQSRTLEPWLGVNYKVEFLSDKKMDKIISLGINLATGKMKENFYSYIDKLELTPVLPTNVSTPRPFLNFREAALQLEEWVLHEVSKEDFEWVIKANHRLEHELGQLEAYYQNHSEIQKENNSDEADEEENLLVEKEKRFEEVKWQYSPRIEVNPINLGIFYLNQFVQNNVEYLH